MKKELGFFCVTAIAVALFWGFTLTNTSINKWNANITGIISNNVANAESGNGDIICKCTTNGRCTTTGNGDVCHYGNSCPEYNDVCYI